MNVAFQTTKYHAYYSSLKYGNEYADLIIHTDKLWNYNSSTYFYFCSMAVLAVVPILCISGPWPPFCVMLLHSFPLNAQAYEMNDIKHM